MMAASKVIAASTMPGPPRVEGDGEVAGVGGSLARDSGPEVAARRLDEAGHAQEHEEEHGPKVVHEVQAQPDQAK